MRRITRRPVTLAGALGLLSLIVSGSASTIVLPHDIVRDTGEAFRAESVYVYQNGFCQVLTTITIDVVNGEAEIELPDGTVLETLRFEGDDVYAIVIREGDPTLLPGDRVRVFLEDARIDGQLIEMGAFWAIETANGTRFVRADEVQSFEIVGAAPPSEGTTRVSIRVSGTDGPRTFALSYIVRGLSWSPSYEIDVEKETLREWVTLKSPTHVIAEKIVLVVGSPSMQFGYSMEKVAYQGMLAGTMADSRSSEPGWSPRSFDHFHEYTLNQSFEFLPSEIVRLHFFEGTIDLQEELVAHVSRWNGEMAAQIEWTFTNLFPEPLPSGTVSFYRQGRLIGQDSLPYMPRNEVARLTSGTERDLVVKIAGRCSRGDWHFEMEAINRDTQAHILFVRFTYGENEDLAKLDPRPAKEESAMALWRLGLEKDDTDKISGVLQIHHDHGGCD